MRDRRRRSGIGVGVGVGVGVPRRVVCRRLREDCRWRGGGGPRRTAVGGAPHRRLLARAGGDHRPAGQRLDEQVGAQGVQRSFVAGLAHAAGGAVEPGVHGERVLGPQRRPDLGGAVDRVAQPHVAAAAGAGCPLVGRLRVDLQHPARRCPAELARGHRASLRLGRHLLVDPALLVGLEHPGRVDHPAQPARAHPAGAEQGQQPRVLVHGRRRVPQPPVGGHRRHTQRLGDLDRRTPPSQLGPQPEPVVLGDPAGGERLQVTQLRCLHRLDQPLLGRDPVQQRRRPQLVGVCGLIRVRGLVEHRREGRPVATGHLRNVSTSVPNMCSILPGTHSPWRGLSPSRLDESQCSCRRSLPMTRSGVEAAADAVEAPFVGEIAQHHAAARTLKLLPRSSVLRGSQSGVSEDRVGPRDLAE